MHDMGQRHYNHGKIKPNPKPYNLKALDCYNQAIQTLTATDHPTEHLQLLQNLIKVHLALGNQAEAEQCQLKGLAVLKHLLNAANSKEQRRRIESQFHGFRQLSVDVLLQRGQTIEALTSAEMNKNRSLEQLSGDIVSPDHAQIQSLLAVGQTLVAWHLSPERLTTFVVQQVAAEPAVWVQEVQPFLDWLKDWDEQYSNYRPKQKRDTEDATRKTHPWRTDMETRLAKLAEILQIADIAAQLGETEQLILVPHRDLHRLPLHALFVNLGGAITYLPSIQTGLTLKAQFAGQHEATTAASPTLLSIENPHGDLRFAHIESAAINALLPNVNPLAGAAATQSAILAQLQTPHDILHFTGHGAYNSRQPQNSALALAGDDELTAATIQTFDLSGYQLVYLAACETALTGQSSIDEEYVGLASAFLQANARAVISTLWTVEEISSAWLAIRFYQLWLQEDQPMAAALQGAQTWLRTVTIAQLIPWLEQLAPQLAHTDAHDLLTDELVALRRSPKIESQPPYSHPYYWAAFTLTGGTL